MSLLIKGDNTLRSLGFDIYIQLVAGQDCCRIDGKDILCAVTLGITYVRYFLSVTRHEE